MSWIVLAMAIEFGFVPNAAMIPWQPPAVEEQAPAFGMQIEAEMLIHDLIFLGGSAGVSSLDPDRLDFTLSAGIRKDALEIGVRYFSTKSGERSYEKIYIRIGSGK